MIKSVAVIVLLPFRDIPLFWITRVVKARVVKLPGDAGRASSLDGIGQQFTGRGFDHPQRADFRSTRRGAVRDVLSILRWRPPIKSNSSVRRQRIHIYQWAVFTLQAFADQKHWLILRALALRIKIIFTADLRG